MRLALVFGLLSTLFLACESKTPSPTLNVTAHGPTGDVDDPRAVIKISFDRPVVKASDVGQPIKAPPVKITPSLAVFAHWLDRQTLILKPEQPLAKATRYSVSTIGVLNERLASSFSFSFVFDPLDVVGVTEASPEWLSPQGTFSLTFDQEVTAEDVVDHCKLVAQEPSEEVDLSTKAQAFTGTVIPLEAEKRLSQGRAYTLRCEGIKPVHGNEPLRNAYEASLRVYPTLSLSGTTPAEGASVTPDDLTLSLSFSTPVDCDELMKHLSSTPRSRALSHNWVQQESTVCAATVTLEADTDYTLEIRKDLKDQFGQALDAKKTLRFRTTDASPSISAEHGIYAIEPSTEGYPVWSRNVDTFDFACAYIPKKRIAQVLTSDMNYDPWYYAGDHSGEIDWKKLGVAPKKLAIKPTSTKNKWIETRVDLPTQCGKGKRGVYLAEIRSSLVEKVRAERGGLYPYRLLGNVTDLGVLLKIGPASGLVWVASLTNNEPSPGATVTLYDPRGKQVWTGVTDAQGLVMTPGSGRLLPGTASADADPYGDGDYHEQYRDQRLIAVVEKEDDFAVVDGNWQNGIQAWNFGMEVDHAGGDVRIRGFIESDRGIYRPGETVHFKGLAREITVGGPMRVPTGQDVRVNVEDGRGASIYDAMLPISEFGGFHFDLTLDPGAPTGDYYVTATLAKQSFRQTFSVEEIKPVTFEIEADKTPSSMRLHETTKLALSARYLFGAPVTEAEVNYEITRQPHYVSFAGYEQYSFVDYSEMEWTPWWEPESYNNFVSDGKTQTDKKGRFSFDLKDPSKDLNGPQDYLVRARVRDAADQQVTKRLTITAHPSEFYMGIHPQEWVQAVNMPFALNLVAVDPQGKQVKTDAKLTVERVRWDCGVRNGPDGYWSCERKRKELESRDVKLTDSGVRVERVLAKEPGELSFRIETKDAKGARVVASSTVWVIGEGEAFWSGDESARMGLIASKTKYAPGDVAKLVPQASTKNATMLVTIERNGILEARVEKPEGASAGISIPITKEHAPNMFVSVAMIRGRRGPSDAERPDIKMGMLKLPVSYDAERLKVEVTTAGSDFEPGAVVQGKVRVTGADGLPVRAEVALSAADEGVLQLIGYKTPNPIDSLYAPWGLGIDTATTWNRVLQRRHTPVDADGEAGADSSGASGDRVRTRFEASAFWAPALITDAEGYANFSFTAPDNLTAFRLMAAAADAGTRFGATDTRIRVRKDLLITPALPRFATLNDEIELSAVVHNYTEKAGPVEVRFDMKGVEPKTKTVKLDALAPNTKGVARVKVKVTGRQAVTFKASASLEAAKDALEVSFPILRPSVREVDTLIETRGLTSQATVSYPEGLDTVDSKLEISVDRTGLSSLGPSLRYLIQYPYGCLEQTMSGLVPLLKVRDLAKSMKLSELEGPKLDTYVKLGIAKVIRHQHADGHFSLWPSSETYPHLTVYALWGLNEARRAGVRVEKRAIDLGISAMRTWVNDATRTLAPGDETATMAMAAFVLAELAEPDPALNARLFAARKALPNYGKAFLLRAMLKAKAQAADLTLLEQELRAEIEHTPEGSFVHEKLRYDEHYWGTDVRSAAMVLSALLELSITHPEVDGLVSGLRKKRSAGRWASTQDNLYALVALADYARAERSGIAQLVVKLGERVLAKKTLTGADLLTTRVSLSDIPSGASLTIESDAPVYAMATLERVKPEAQAAALSRGFDIQRSFLDFRTEHPISQVKVGDLVKVKINIITKEDMRYVAISDPLPSGFESVNTKLQTEADLSAVEPMWGFWNYRALRDERTDFFADDLTARTVEISYVIRATHPGRFLVPPTYAEEMYSPSVMGHAQSAILTVVR